MDADRLEAHARKYVAKLAADTILAEPPTRPDLSDAGLEHHFAGCVRPPTRAEYDMIRAGYLTGYGVIV